VISDGKSSRGRWPSQQVADTAEQLLLYAELARDLATGKPLRIELTVLTKSKEVNIETNRLPMTADHLSRTKRVVERVWQAIEGEHFYPSPSPLHCAGCPFRAPCRQWTG
jgi:CRISPR/Cas system-associated exonuclease Cas4 (RecB family)